MGLVAAGFVAVADSLDFDVVVVAGAAESIDNAGKSDDAAHTADDVIVVVHAAPSVDTDCMALIDCAPVVDEDILAENIDQSRIREMDIVSFLAVLKKVLNLNRAKHTTFS